MNCIFCKGSTYESKTKFIVDLGNCVVIVKNVPARICRQCGEESFSDKVARQLEKMVAAVKNSLMSEVAIIGYPHNVA